MIFLHLLIILILVIVQAGVMPFLEINGTAANLVIAAIIVVYLLRRYDLLSLYLATGGLLSDVFSSWRFGTMTIFFGLTVIIFHLLSRRFVWKINFWLTGLLLGLSSFIWSSLFLFWNIRLDQFVILFLEQWLVGWLIFYPIFRHFVQPEEPVKISRELSL